MKFKGCYWEIESMEYFLTHRYICHLVHSNMYINICSFFYFFKLYIATEVEALTYLRTSRLAGRPQHLYSSESENGKKSVKPKENCGDDTDDESFYVKNAKTKSSADSIRTRSTESVSLLQKFLCLFLF